MTHSSKQHLRRTQWTIFGLVIVAYMLSFFHRVAPAALSTDLQASFSATSAQLGIIAAVFFFVIMLMQIPTGIMADTLGSRKILGFGCAVTAAGCFVFASAHNVLLASIGRGLIGFGAAIPFVALLRLNASWFAATQFATLSGLTILFGNLGAILSTSPLETLSHTIGWRPIITVSGILTALIGTLIIWFVRDKPADYGLPSPDGAANYNSDIHKKIPWQNQLWAVIRNRDTWPCFWVGFGICGTFFTFTSLWGVPYLMQTLGISKQQAAAHILVMIFCHSLTALFLGRASDRMENRKGLLLCLATLYVVMWIPMLAGLHVFTGASFLIFALQGIGSTSYTLIWAIAKEVNPVQSAGMAIGVTNTSMFLAAAILQPVIGFIIDRNPTNGMLFGVGLLTVVSAFGLIYGLKLVETHGHNIYAKRFNK